MRDVLVIVCIVLAVIFLLFLFGVINVEQVH